MVLKEFDSITAPNKDVLNWYFRDGLSPSIRAHLDKHGKDLNICNKTIKKAIDIEKKAS